MADFTESRLCFSFDTEWQIFKVEEHPDCKQVFKKIPGIKDVDFLGLHQGKVFFIEAKNYTNDLPRQEAYIKSDSLSNALENFVIRCSPF
jgi:hypothetical protein